MEEDDKRKERYTRWKEAREKEIKLSNGIHMDSDVI